MLPPTESPATAMRVGSRFCSAPCWVCGGAIGGSPWLVRKGPAGARWGDFGGGLLPGGEHFVPESAAEVEIVAAGLAGGGVADVGVQRVPVVGELVRAAGAGDRGDLARQACAGRGGAGYRGPVRGAAAVAFRAGRGVGGERVEREALG